MSASCGGRSGGTGGVHCSPAVRVAVPAVRVAVPAVRVALPAVRGAVPPVRLNCRETRASSSERGLVPAVDARREENAPQLEGECPTIRAEPTCGSRTGRAVAATASTSDRVECLTREPNHGGRFGSENNADTARLYLYTFFVKGESCRVVRVSSRAASRGGRRFRDRPRAETNGSQLARLCNCSSALILRRFCNLSLGSSATLGFLFVHCGNSPRNGEKTGSILVVWRNKGVSSPA